MGDARGANALVGIGMLGLAASGGYVLAAARAPTLAPSLASAGFSLALLIGGALRRFCGRALVGGVERLHALQDAPGPLGTGLARLFAFIVDLAALLALALGAYQLFRFVDADPRVFSICRMQLDQSGLAFLRAYRPCFATHEGADALSGGLAALACGAWLLVPAATWGATPGLLLIGRRWVRSDGNRVGALHGVVRALGGIVLSPLQALVAVLLLFRFANRWRNVRTGEVVTQVTWGILALLRRPRTVADRICGTEAIR